MTFITFHHTKDLKISVTKFTPTVVRDASSPPLRRRSYTLQAEELHLASVAFRQTTPIFYPVLRGWKQGLCGLHRRPWQNAISTHTKAHTHTLDSSPRETCLLWRQSNQAAVAMTTEVIGPFCICMCPLSFSISSYYKALFIHSNKSWHWSQQTFKNLRRAN